VKIFPLCVVFRVGGGGDLIRLGWPSGGAVFGLHYEEMRQDEDGKPSRGVTYLELYLNGAIDR